MRKGLLQEAFLKYLAGVVLLFILLFVPAGDIHWKNGWLFMGLLFLPMLVAGLVMYRYAPNLLRRRLKAKESQQEQKEVIGASGLMFIAVFVLAGLNHRFGWSTLPDGVVVVSSIVFLFAYALFGEVLRENEYLSRTVEVQENQKVIDTGLYGIVRHPMYMATVLLFLAMPLILNCIYSFVLMLGYIPLIMKRIRNEEAVLEAELNGYRDYQKKVRYRLLPYIW